MLRHPRAEMHLGNLSATTMVPKHTMLILTPVGCGGGAGAGVGCGGGAGVRRFGLGGALPPALVSQFMTLSANGCQFTSWLASHCFTANFLYM